MADKLVNTLVIQQWTILNTATPSAPLSGQTAPADVTTYLLRESVGTMIAALEAVAMVETGVTGHYFFTWTPENTGVYKLQIQELNAASLQRWMIFPDFTILPAGAIFTPVFTNAFCSEADVERWTQLGFTATSTPTTNDVAAFAESRASELISMMASAGVSITPDTVVADSIEEDMLRDTNAIGAAADAIMAKFMMEAPNRSEKAVLLLEEYDKRVERLMKYVNSTLGAHSVRTHITSGEVTLPTVSNITDGGLREAIKMDDEF